ncbi:Urb2/Npa2 family-domain-containing protein [Mycena maculata]|uniref:Urb2/Npa2 family-domain-containing protein n=1 Tax=Mycena maculata TaxID=230809 RepID=A0AAD7KE70_9AGAR|nr:Urb2/Npa2 family-domain-containing protein [Mycena maculata]
MASQAVYHALKAPTDPPRVGGPLKIEIASRAWDDKSLYMPNKGEVITEWVLVKLLKDKANSPALNPVLDPQFWALLSDIVTDVDQTKSKQWLLPLLNRVPVAPVVSAFLQLLNTVEGQLRVALTNVVLKSLISIWPLAVHKMSTETLLESFGTFLGALETSHEPNDGLEQIGDMVISSLRVSVGNSSNKKKISSLFIQKHLRKWILSSSGRLSSGLRENVYVAGVETLLNADTLRQVHDEDHQLFIALRNLPDDTVHPLLPGLFSSFVHSTRKHRSALFGQGFGHTPAAIAEQLRMASFSFFDACQALLNVVHPTILTWEARVGLLGVVGEENLFSSSQHDGQMSLKNIVPLVLSVLGSDLSGACSAKQASLSVACLSKLMQIDHDLILEDVPRILPQLRRISNPFPSIFSFLELLLEYHVRTRTMHEHVESLFAALAPPSREIADIRAEYCCSSSSALLHPTHLERLAKSMQKFLTPTQTGQTVKLVLETLHSLWDQMLAASDPESSRLAPAFSFSATLASVVLTALPFQALPATTLQEVTDSISDMRSNFVPRALTKTLKTIRKKVADSWGFQVIAAALLRLGYALNAPSTEKLWTSAEIASQDENLLPELSLELFRMLLKWTSVTEPTRTQGPMERLLMYLENNYGSLEASWSGVSCSLTFGSRGKAESVLAILHMLIDRWLPTIDVIASTVQLQRFVTILVKSNVREYVPHLNATSLLLTALSSAQFWELPNLRAAVLAFADAATSALVDSNAELTTDDHTAIFSAYKFLLMLPIEYMSRTTRTELVRRAVNADVLYNPYNGTKDVYSNVTVVRVFIHNTTLYVGSVGQPVATLSRYLNHLVHHNLPSPAPQSYTAVTLNLIELHLSALFKSSEPGSAEATLDVLRLCLPTYIPSSANESRILVRLVELLIRGFSPTNFAEDVQDEIFNLQRRLSAALANHVQEMDILFANEELMDLWLHTLSLGRWAKLDNRMAFLGRKLCSWASNPSAAPPNADGLDGNRIAAFAILAEELRSIPDRDRLSHLSIILAIYVSLGQLASANGQNRFDQLLSQTCNTLSVTEFSYLLDLTSECLSDATHSAHDMSRLVHMATLLLSDHPTSTLKYTQKFLTSCLNMFAGRGEFTNGPLRLRLEVLRLLRQQCSESPASLRTLDIGSIWSILSKFLTKSKQHDEQTSMSAFHEITAIIGALIRLRRDLVALTLPNLALVLQQLMVTIRRPRPQLGAKQTALVTDSLPRWINSADPVGPEEGKDLARLLETLTTKTTIRTHSSTADAQKAESLARPFSKHAAYVIKAYIDAMNDTLCILPSQLRKELRPGLFALCGMLNDHSRDAMMASALDAGGKTIMKALWADYEKQKYIGKG